MSKYFQNVKSFDDLKEQFKVLAKKYHPDMGGDTETMQDINAEYDALFVIWKNRREAETGETINETASGTRRKFYTQNGWEGSRYDMSLSTKQIAKIVRNYCKEKYPTWKFSVTFKSFAGGSEINMTLLEAPVEVFDREWCMKNWGNYAEMLENDNVHHQIYAIYDRREDYPELTDIGYEVLHDVYSFMQSYNYDDSDGMIDYFDTNFYSCLDIGRWDRGFKVVPKTARVTKNDDTPVEKENGKYTYTITKGEDTRDGSELWVVRIVEHLDKDEYIAENKAMKQRGGYYSKFKKGFIFREDPTEILNNVA